MPVLGAEQVAVAGDDLLLHRLVIVSGVSERSSGPQARMPAPPAGRSSPTRAVAAFADPRSTRAKCAAARPAQMPEEIAQAALWLPPPVKPPQISSRVAASPAA